jgi:hypothetical protein
MKKLQSLENFNASGLSQKFLSKLTGGAEPNKTPAGCQTTDNLDRTSTGCMSYTSDTIENGGTTYHGVKDIKTCNCD